MLVNGRRSLVLESAVARLVVDLQGGSFVEFQYHDQGLNPLVWNNDGDPNERRQMSHFLCLDRWGSPSVAEAKSGMPYHGEAGLVEWQVIDRPLPGGILHRAMLKARLPIAGLDVLRFVDFGGDPPYFTVTEKVTNYKQIGSILNMVQHPSIGPPFLDEGTLIDTNAGQGFALCNSKPNPEARSTRWPQALNNAGKPINMRYLRDEQDPDVVAYAIDEDQGWVTAANPASGLLIGYIWKTSDYPWFIAWRRTKNGKPLARGLEFGTTGLDWPHDELVRKGQIFGRPLFVYLDSGLSLSRSFTCFLLRVPKNYTGVESVSHHGSELKINERNNGRSSREIVVPLISKGRVIAEN